MKLARLYIPKYPNQPVFDLEARLSEHFQGYTMYAFGVGVWMHPDAKVRVQEAVYIYDVVIKDSDDWVLHSILEEYKQAALQHSVLYILNNEPITI